ncbi:MAG: hypothetical protein JW716_03145 [Candidatus Aenigmarchaeota archaeon]|nr:hypothetical protein [Candidatus Aenigmarchaeota archaeon]
MRSKKGQTVFEFILAAIVLFSIIIYTLTYVGGEVSLFSNSFDSDKMESKIVQVSEALLNPYSKYSISDEWPVFNRNKMIIFNNTCNGNYPTLLNDLQLYKTDPLGGQHNIHLIVKAEVLTQPITTVIDCGRMPTDLVERPRVFEIKRMGTDSVTGLPVDLKILIWEGFIN